MFYLGSSSAQHKVGIDEDFARWHWYRDEQGHIRLQFMYGLDTVVFV